MSEEEKENQPLNPIKENIEGKHNLWQKISKAKELVGVVKKNGKVEFKSTKYNYQTAEDIDIACRDAFQDVGIVIVPLDFEIINDKDGIVTTIQTFGVVDVDTGTYVKVKMGGMGQDSGDKRIYKAETGAYKYLLKQLLQIPSQDDPDKIPSGAWETPKPTSDGKVNWREYVVKLGNKHKGKTLEEVAKTDKQYIEWASTKQGEHQPYCQACLEELNSK